MTTRLERIPVNGVSVIEADARWQPLDLGELWRYRELLFFFTWRDIKIRYKQTELGAIWAILQPLTTTGIFVLLFGLLMQGNEPSVPGVPYALSTFCAMLPWQFFSEGLTRSGNSLIQDQGLITKVYFPRLLLPISSVATGLVDFGVAFVALLLMMAWYGLWPSWAVLALPGFVALAAMASLAVGVWLSALSAIYRDFRHVQPFLIRVGMYVSPVIYASSSLKHALPEWALALYSLNPMVGVIEGFRWALLGKAPPPGWALVPSVVITAVLFVSGLFYFRRMERTVVDVI